MIEVALLHGDVREVLALLDSESVDVCVTSPPYWGLRDYGLELTVWDGDDECCHEWSDGVQRAGYRSNDSHPGALQSIATQNRDAGPASHFCASCDAWLGTLGLEPTPQLYVQHMVQIFREVWRVLKPWGTVWLNFGDSYAGSNNGSNDYREEWSSISASGAKYQGQKPGLPAGLKPKDLVGIPWRVAFALQEDGWWLRSDIIWAKPNPMPESVRDRPTKAHEYLFLLTKASTYYFDQEAVREPGHAQYHGSVGSKTGANGDRNDGGRAKENTGAIGRNIRDVWTIPTQPYPEAHFATFPEKLVEPCIKAGTSEKGNCPECGKPWERVVEKTAGVSIPGPKTQAAHEARGGVGVPSGTVGKSGSGRIDGTSVTLGWQPTCDHDLEPVPAVVLDPFIGSGTTAKVALRLGRAAIGIDASAEYLELARKRIDGTQTALALDYTL